MKISLLQKVKRARVGPRCIRVHSIAWLQSDILVFNLNKYWFNYLHLSLGVYTRSTHQEQMLWFALRTPKVHVRLASIPSTSLVVEMCTSMQTFTKSMSVDLISNPIAFSSFHMIVYNTNAKKGRYGGGIHVGLGEKSNTEKKQQQQQHENIYINKVWIVQ